ncbi:phage tail protein [Ferrimonas balearica]|nr:phage tail protein [Ferrimonas balearica]
MTIVAIHRDPMAMSPISVRRLARPVTLSEMAAGMHLPPDFARRGRICINGHEVPRGVWPLVRPKPHGPVPIEVTFHAPAMGGGGGDGKNVFALVAAIALTVATGFIAANGIGFLGIAGGSTAATLAAAGISALGSMLISALIPPPSLQQAEGKNNRALGTASATGNVLEPNGAVPRVVGTRKIFPPLAAEPFVYFDGEDEVVEAIFILAGPHKLEGLRVDGARIEDLSGVVHEAREGWPGDARISLIQRQSRTEQIGGELRGHVVSGGDGSVLESSSGDLSDALPMPRTSATREAPDEQQLQLAFSAGLHLDGGDTKIRVPFRLRIRRFGEETWRNLPELHFQGASVRAIRSTIRFRWVDDASGSSDAASSDGWVEARIASPDQDGGPDWQADPYFDTDAGGADYLSTSTNSTTDVQRVILSRYEAQFLLDREAFPPGIYEVEITRGFAFQNGQYSAGAYTLNGAVRDFWGYQGGAASPSIAQTRDRLADTVQLVRSVSIWNEHPLPTDDFAAIAVVARNQELDDVSVLASGYVQDWDGAGWSNWVTTSNPAPHLRDIIGGMLSAKAVHPDLVDDVALVAWRDACTALGYTCNAILEDLTVADAARIVGAAGYGQLGMSEKWGVVRDYDRSAETPVQVFTPREAQGFSWSRAFADLPDGFRVTFVDRDRDYAQRQLVVYRDGRPGGLVEQVTYEGLVTEAEVRERVAYDFANARRRGTTYSLTASAEAVVCRRGSLVGVQHDMLTRQAGQGRVLDWELDEAGEVMALTLDDGIPLLNEPFMDEVPNLAAEPDLSVLGARTGLVLRRTDGTMTTHEVSTPTGRVTRLELSAPTSEAGIDHDILAVVGRKASELRRMIVFAIEPRDELTFDLTLVDEAPEIWAA